MKKFLTIFAILTLVISSFTVSFATDGTVDIDWTSGEQPNLDTSQFNLNSEVFEKSNLKLSDEENVRLIVELTEKPVITHATEAHKKVNELPKRTLKSITQKIITQQRVIKNLLASKNYNIKYHKDFKNVFNGFSCTTKAKEVKNLKKIPGIKNVYVAMEYTRPIPKMHESVTTVGARTLWSKLGYTGEGKVVAIIDTGIDPSHHDMALSNPNNEKINQQTVNNLDLPGTWRSDKVPYGYNYYDKNQEILDLGKDASRHGMHVAGIVGANGNESNGGIKGVAPESQLLAMKVFGNTGSGTTSSDVYIKAIDDSILLGADVINMSLGSPAGYVSTDFPAQLAIKKAVDNGIVVAVSGGNSHRFGNGFKLPTTDNPDTGLVGAPGTTLESFQISSVNNTTYLYENNFSFAPLNNNVLGYSADNWKELLTSSDSLELTSIGGTKLGKLTDYDGIDVTGKVVLVKRGEHPFRDKTLWAKEKGAKAIIVYDHGQSTFYKNQGNWDIPFALISKEDGEALESLLENGSVNFSASLEKKYINPISGLLSPFSSFGLAPNLVFKPEISAPGGMILSTDQNNGYQLMSGTSMSSPCVAGGSALILQYIDDKFPNLTGESKVLMVKNLMMSTANPILENVGNGVNEFTSPRGQGAGVMDLVKATSAKAIVVDSRTNQSKVALKEISNSTDFVVTVKNLTSENLNYTVEGSVATDLAENGNILAKPQPIVNSSGKTPIKFSSTNITVPANSSTDVKVTLDLNGAKGLINNKSLSQIFKNGCFVEGFITFRENSDVNTKSDLLIPYCGFYGSWDSAPILDGTKYDKSSFYGNSGFIDGASQQYLGQNFDKTFDANKIAFSPNGNNTCDTIVPVLSFYRNARKIDIDILDANNNKILDLVDDEYLSKSFGDGKEENTIYYNPDWKWDGKVNDSVLPDGQYYMRINTIIDYPNSRWNSNIYPIYIDTTKPTITDLKYNEKTSILSASAIDKGSSVHSYVLVENGKKIATSGDGKFDMSKLGTGNHKLFLAVLDYAQNIASTRYFTIPVQ
ncbi:S8 family serine peptidase [Clostridiaceae bacterium M8S5]|nr:S8 family serine peptidase [Clostridiaceae bacterium M8S5]